MRNFKQDQRGPFKTVPCRYVAHLISQLLHCRIPSLSVHVILPELALCNMAGGSTCVLHARLGDWLGLVTCVHVSPWIGQLGRSQDVFFCVAAEPISTQGVDGDRGWLLIGGRWGLKT